MIETDKWAFVPAKFYGKLPLTPRRKVRVIVVHTMEAAEKINTAEAIANYFREMPDNRQASAHVCIDADSVVQCVHDNDVAYAAPGANSDGIQLELAGYAAQTAVQWGDPYSVSLLAIAANVAAQYCLKYDIPAVHLSDADLAAGKRGIIGHVQASRVYKKSDHQDPGPTFPWASFIAQTARYLAERRARFGVGL